MTQQEILAKVDHTLLKPESTWAQIKQICDDAKMCIRDSHHILGPGDRLPQLPLGDRLPGDPQRGGQLLLREPFPAAQPLQLFPKGHLLPLPFLSRCPL